MYLIHTELSGQTVPQMAIGGSYTERRHVERAWDLIREAAGPAGR